MQSKQNKKSKNWTLRLHQIGSTAFFLTGFGHLMAHFFSPETPEKTEIMNIMEQFSIEMPGTQTNLFLFHEGFSIMMGFLLLSFGLLNLILYKLPQYAPKIFIKVLVIDCLVAGISFILSFQYFFVVPVVLMALATLCFIGILVLGFEGDNATSK